MTDLGGVGGPGGFAALSQRMNELNDTFNSNLDAMRVNRTGQDRLGDRVAGLTVRANIVTSVLNKITGSLGALDTLQKSALSVGVHSNTLRKSLGHKMDDLPGGIRVGMEHAIGFMQMGLRTHSKGMLRLANQAKITGQDSQAVIAGFAKLSSVIPISSKGMGQLGENIIDLSRDWGVKSTALIEVLEQNTQTIGTLASQGVSFGDTGEVITSLTARVGQQFAGTIGDLTKQLTFGEGFDDVRKAILQTGSASLVADMRSGNISQDLLMQVARSSIDQWNHVKGNTTDRAQLAQMANLYGINLAQMQQFEAMDAAFNKAENIEAARREKVDRQFNESIGTLLQEIASPIQEMLIPLLSGMTSVLKAVAPVIKENIVEIVAGLFGMWTGQKVHNFWEKINEMRKEARSFKSISLLGVIGYFAGATAGYIAEQVMLAKWQKDNEIEKANERRKAKDHLESERHAWERTLSGARIAVHQATGAALIPGEIPDLLKRILASSDIVARAAADRNISSLGASR